MLIAPRFANWKSMQQETRLYEFRLEILIIPGNTLAGSNSGAALPMDF
jgi:hypothetical protein